ncbi:hypothetical protein LJ754_12180 [Arthrobacter sp. zg-Y40]|uniref:ribonuclease HI n=1 Tax=Arthrobacter sp. zg-Y40 TaxID=2886939 RepID=UPI001D145976|nr:RNase H family protein [Arthrobacter sp. zg-Y40]MCC3279907.1 hypothetical protein [Arthrobacter sp. zg-Y40]
MSFPVPAAPARPFISAADAVALRGGISVRISPKHGLLVWAVAKTVGKDVLALESGAVDAPQSGSQHCLFQAVRAAVVGLQDTPDEEVFCDDENAAKGLGAVGVNAGFRYPPAVAITAMDVAVQAVIRSRFAELTITTDSSRGKSSRCLGHGWVLNFGGDTQPFLGQKASEGGSILEGELRSIRYGLQAARGAYPAAMHGSTNITVRSDSQLALRMLTDPGFEPPASNRFCREEVALILQYTRHAGVNFAWVRGHNGDPHNMAADRLAVLARRSREAELSFDEVQRLTALAHQDVLNDFRRSHMTLAA